MPASSQLLDGKLESYSNRQAIPLYNNLLVLAQSILVTLLRATCSVIL
jgi:hypothetical protein